MRDICFDTMPIARSKSIQEIIVVKAQANLNIAASAFFRQNNLVAFINRFVRVSSTYRMEKA